MILQILIDSIRFTKLAEDSAKFSKLKDSLHAVSDTLKNHYGLTSESVNALLILLAIAITVGAFGGVINYYIEKATTSQDTPSDTSSKPKEESKLSRLAHILIGIAAAMLVPLFLYLTQSKLLDNICTPKLCTDYFVFAGYCLIVAIMGRKFIVMMSDRIAKIAKEANEKATKAEKKATHAEDTAKEAVADAGMKGALSARTILEAEKKNIPVSFGKQQKSTSTSNEPVKTHAIKKGKNPIVAHDLNKNQFGGKPEDSGKILRAELEDSGSGWYWLTLDVESIDAAKPLNDGTEVVFHLHDTFDPDVISEKVKNGKAEIRVLTWGAFTVGVDIPSEGIQLELDLSKEPKFPKEFRER